VTYVAVRFVDVIVNYWKDRNSADADKGLNDQLIPVLSKSLKAFVITLSVLVTSQNLGIEITGILTSLSIGGLALGLAAQDTIANLFGAVAVYIDKPFKIGERIKIENVDGTVEIIGLRSTRIRNLDGHLVTIPNKTMGNATIINVSRRSHIKTEINLGLVYETTSEQLQQAVEILQRIFKNENTHDVIITFNNFADSSLNIQVVHWWKGTDYLAYLKGLQAFNLAIKTQFAQANLSMAFPSRTLYLKQDSDWKITPKQQ
jgi:MscS family membrane protein